MFGVYVLMDGVEDVFILILLEQSVHIFSPYHYSTWKTIMSSVTWISFHKMCVNRIIFFFLQYLKRGFNIFSKLTEIFFWFSESEAFICQTLECWDFRFLWFWRNNAANLDLLLILVLRICACIFPHRKGSCLHRRWQGLTRPSINYKSVTVIFVSWHGMISHSDGSMSMLQVQLYDDCLERTTAWFLSTRVLAFQSAFVR
jgi:hypothetical protein